MPTKIDRVEIIVEFCKNARNKWGTNCITGKFLKKHKLFFIRCLKKELK